MPSSWPETSSVSTAHPLCILSSANSGPLLKAIHLSWQWSGRITTLKSITLISHYKIHIAIHCHTYEERPSHGQCQVCECWLRFNSSLPHKNRICNRQERTLNYLIQIWAFFIFSLGKQSKPRDSQNVVDLRESWSPAHQNPYKEILTALPIGSW